MMPRSNRQSAKKPPCLLVVFCLRRKNTLVSAPLCLWLRGIPLDSPRPTPPRRSHVNLHPLLVEGGLFS